MVGLTAGIDLESRENNFAQRAFEVLDRAFHEYDVMLRVTGDTIALTPPLIISKEEIEMLVSKIRNY